MSGWEPLSDKLQRDLAWIAGGLAVCVSVVVAAADVLWHRHRRAR